MSHRFPSSTVLIRAGVLGDHIPENARSTARLHGIRLAGLCGNIWPADDDGLHRFVADEIVRELSSFALYARRYMELVDVAKKGAFRSDGPLLRINDGLHSYEMDGWTAINRIVHASRLEAEFVTPLTTKHDNLGDLILLHIIVTSREMAKIHVCPQGLFYGFMTTQLDALQTEEVEG